jgi:putative ABC transport system ATP-binding protein
MSASASDGRGERLLVLGGVWRTFSGAPAVDALRAATFDVRSGEMIALVGRSGSGKSTLLNVLGLLDRPSRGTYEVLGVDVAALSEVEATALRSSFFGFVFQKAHLVPHRTARENVEIALIPRGINRAERRRRASDVLDSVGLADRRDALPGTLSGGEAQRVAIARAIAQQPRVLLCDEPTGNLDRATGDQVMELFVDLNRRGLTVVIATHDEAIAGSLPRRLVVTDGVVSDVGPQAALVP